MGAFSIKIVYEKFKSDYYLLGASLWTAVMPALHLSPAHSALGPGHEVLSSGIQSVRKKELFN